MTSIETVGTIFIKILKLPARPLSWEGIGWRLARRICTIAVLQVLNLIIIILYRTGYQGSFLGVGGTWNLNEEKNADAEIVASGVFVGYFVYTAVSLISLCFATADHKNTFTDILMNIVGVFLWVAVGATALHYWHGYLAEHKYTYVDSERQVGLALGALCVINGAAYLVDTVISVIFLIKTKMQ